MLVLDFSKAFDKVQHELLLYKLAWYGIKGHTLAWISSWIQGRTQCLVVNGEQSAPSVVKSGVPQGMVLGPLMFLLFISDIVDNVQSMARLFADDCVLYCEICSPEDQMTLQQDLNRLIKWSSCAKC